MLVLSYVLATIIGLAIGSFYTATSVRVIYYFYGPGRKHKTRWKEFLTKPSFCMHCETPIRIIDLVPVIGYLKLKGRCNNCGNKIGMLTLVGEVLPGIMLPLMLYSGWSWPASLSGALLSGHLFISATTDYNFFLLDHENTAIIFLIALWGSLAKSSMEFVFFRYYLFTAGTVLIIFVLLFFLSKMKGLGFADILLATSLALYTGFPWSLILFQVASLGSIIYIFLIKKERHAPIPFGTFLAGGTILTIFAECIWMILHPL